MGTAIIIGILAIIVVIAVISSVKHMKGEGGCCGGGGDTVAEDGIMIVVVTLERHSNVILAGPDIVSRGFVYVRESEDLMDGAREVVENALDSCLERNITDWGKIKTVVKDALSEFLWKRTKRSPMILPIIMEA